MISLGSDLKTCGKKKEEKKFMVKLFFSPSFIPLDPNPDPRTQMYPDPDPHPWIPQLKLNPAQVFDCLERLVYGPT